MKFDKNDEGGPKKPLGCPRQILILALVLQALVVDSSGSFVRNRPGKIQHHCRIQHHCILKNRKLNVSDTMNCPECCLCPRGHHCVESCNATETTAIIEPDAGGTEPGDVEKPIVNASETGYVSATEYGDIEERNVKLKIPVSCILLLGFVVFPSVVIQRLTTPDKQTERLECFMTPDKDHDTRKRKIVSVADESFLIKYGAVDKIGRYKMLLTCARKARQMGNTNYGRTLLQGYRIYTGDKRKIGCKTYKELCRMVAANITAEEWMRFVRLHLNLDNDEVKDARLKYCVITTEHSNQIQYWSQRPAELHSLLKQEFKK